MSLIIFANIMAETPTALISPVATRANVFLPLFTVVVMLAIIPLIVYIERGHVVFINYAKARCWSSYDGWSVNLYLPIKVSLLQAL